MENSYPEFKSLMQHKVKNLQYKDFILEAADQLEQINAEKAEIEARVKELK